MSNYKKILVLDNEIEARLVDCVLKERNIPHLLKSYENPVYDGIFQVQMGWGYIEADPKYTQKILETYKNIKNKCYKYLNDLD